MALTSFMQKRVLDWTLGGAGVITAPAQQWLSLASGIPNDNGASDAGQINSRLLINSGAVTGMAAANSPQGSATNLSARSNATATAAAVVSGWNLYDANAGGNRLAYGSMTLGFTVASAASVFFSAGRFNVSLS